MQEVRECRLDAAQQPRERERHPELLAPRREDERLDPVRDELGATRHGRDPQLAALPPERAEQALDVGLVAGPVPAERVRVDHDERPAHCAASR